MSSIFDTPLLKLGAEADRIRRMMWGLDTFYIKNLHINFTNICTNKCKFCAFGIKEGEKGGYTLSIEDVLEKVRNDGKDALELHIVGGLHPRMDLGYYTDMLSALKAEFPGKTLKAFGAAEMAHISNITGVPLKKVFTLFKNAGLDMMPGGGAEIFDAGVREKICPEKISGERWLEVMETAHDCGLKTNATMLYGHLENKKQREDHLLALRKLQEKTGGFNAFIPLTFQPGGTAFAGVRKATAADSLAVTAASRIILDNIPHIKAYWVMLGIKQAQVALRFGADDMDGTVVKENIAYAAGGSTARSITENSLRELITSAGLNPVERDSFYNRAGNQRGNNE